MFYSCGCLFLFLLETRLFVHVCISLVLLQVFLYLSLSLSWAHLYEVILFLCKVRMLVVWKLESVWACVGGSHMHADRLRPAVIVSVCCPHQDTGEPQFATASMIICLCALQNVLWLSNLEFLCCFALLLSRSLQCCTTSWPLAQMRLSKMLLKCLL